MKPLFVLPFLSALFNQFLSTNLLAEDSSSTTSPTVNVYEAEVFFNTINYFGAYFSHDSQNLLVTSDQSGVFNIYRMPLNGEAAKPLTHSTSQALFAVSWFPHDQRFLYLADHDGDELDHLYVHELNGTTTDLTPGKNLKAEFHCWSGDKKHFWVLTNERDSKNFDLYRYATDNYQRQLIFQNEEGWADLHVSRDERWLALHKIHDNADSDIYLLDFQTLESKPQLITPHTGNVTHTILTFSPNSKQLYYLTNQCGEFNQAWHYDLSSGKQQTVIATNWDVDFLHFSATGRYRMVGINADARTMVQIFDTHSEQQVELPKLPHGNINDITFAPDDSNMAFYFNSSTSPYNIYVFDLKNKTLRQLTTALNPALNPHVLVEAEVIRYQSFDGLKIPAILYKPLMASANNPVAALVWVHGGPGGQSRLTYEPILQHLVNHGYAILAVNNRGSSGYGKTFFHLDDRKHGQVDLEDCVYGRQYLQTLPWVNHEKIGIIGESYGGFMVVAALAFKPNTFAVGINIFGVTNWIRTLKNIPDYWESTRRELYTEMGDPLTDAQRLRAISPLFHTTNINKPLLVIQGANDPRVLQIESDELVKAVRQRQIPVEYILFSDEGHGFQKRENRVAASNAYVKFLDQYLKHHSNTTPTPSSSPDSK
jgi:dipeptidyl aminopeptidase/acylaminoacyl peptidase